MDWLTFVAHVISALAWPVTVLVIILILRRPLTNLVPLLQRLRFQGIELDFSREVHALAFEARGQIPGVRGVLDDEGPLRDQWVELAQFSPRAVVLEAWLHLEKAGIEASRRHGLKLKSAEIRSPLILGQALEEAGILEGNTPAIYHQLAICATRRCTPRNSPLHLIPPLSMPTWPLAWRSTCAKPEFFTLFLRKCDILEDGLNLSIRIA